MTSTPRILVALIWGIVLSARSVGAQTTPKPSRDTLRGAVCNPPSFSFRWIGPGAVQLVARSKPAGWFFVWIQEGHSDDGHDGLVRPVNDERPIYAPDDDAGKAYTVDLEKMDLLTSVGRVRIWYLADEPCTLPGAVPTRTRVAGGSSRSIWAMLQARSARQRSDKPKGMDDSSEGNAGVVRASASGAAMAAQAPLQKATRSLDRSVSERQDSFPNETDEQFQQIDGVVALEMHHLSIDIGTVLNMRADSTLEANPEFALSAASRWTTVFAGAMDIRLSSLTVPNSNGSSTSTGPSSLTSGTSNVLEGAGRIIWLPGGNSWSTPLFGLVGGAGVRSLPSDALKLEGNTIAGIRLNVPRYNTSTPADSLSNTRGYLEAGYLHDRYWKNDHIQTNQRHRYYIESQLEIPAVGGEHVRFLLRVRASKPLRFDGPSELRLSALLTIDPAVLRTLFGVPK